MNGYVYAQETIFSPPVLEHALSADKNTLFNAVPTLVLVADPDPMMQGIRAVGPVAAEALAAPEAAVSTFAITYIPAGGTDAWGEPCFTFPAAAKTAFTAAAAVWSSKLKSTVPIKINACWAKLGSSSILGYSGGQPQHRNFPGAPKADTWYQATLANSIAGNDLATADPDMHITYNSKFTWYYGTDGNTPAGLYDLVSVAAHEIGHGLNFSGTASYASGTGSFGIGGSPNVYDTFMKDGAGRALTAYTNPSVALGTLLTSGNLWFVGTNANAANGGGRVKMYAPATWAGGSSYSHLDYNTYKSTTNSLMVYALGSGASNHNAGAVTLGLMKDLGWQVATAAPVTVPTAQAPTGTAGDTTPTFEWTKVTGATQYRFVVTKGTTTTYSKTVPSTACGAVAGVCTTTPATPVLAFGAYTWKVQAMKGGVWKAYSANKAFTVSATPLTKTPTGTIADTTPTYSWTTVSGATQYRLVLTKGVTIQYTKTVATAACGAVAGVCSNTPATVLVDAAYLWKVQAMVGGVWKAYSPDRTFTVATNIAKAGHWEYAYGGFYVTPAKTKVDNFYLRVNVTGCPYSHYTIMHSGLQPITNKNFSFTGAFFATGTFDTATTAHGTLGLRSYYIAGCGIFDAKPYSWTATWVDASQPALVIEGPGGAAADALPSQDSNSNGLDATATTTP